MSEIEHGEFGRAVPLYPLPELRRCPRGHRLDVAGVSRSYSHIYGRMQRTCRVCHELDPYTAAWCELDPARQVDQAQAIGSGLELVAFAPAGRGGVGRIAVHLDGHAWGDIHAAICAPCRRAVIEHVTTEFPRRGIGRVLVSAALARGPHCRWSTTRLEDTATARAFWSATAPHGLQLGQPTRCSDMTSEGCG